jgi:hypothetical protein
MVASEPLQPVRRKAWHDNDAGPTSFGERLKKKLRTRAAPLAFEAVRATRVTTAFEKPLKATNLAALKNLRYRQSVRSRNQSASYRQRPDRSGCNTSGPSLRGSYTPDAYKYSCRFRQPSRMFLRQNLR